jgi:hypothetical protein
MHRQVPPIKPTSRPSSRNDKEFDAVTRERNVLREKVKQLESAVQQRDTESQQLASQIDELRAVQVRREK